MTEVMPAAVLEECYRRMQRVRRFEEKVIELHSRGKIPGAVHISIGQEGTVAGACLALAGDDYITGTHRSHAHPIGKGAALGPLMAELMGKRTGVCRGKGGSMHLADFGVGSLGETAIVGSALPVAAGAGLSAKLRSSSQVCLAFFGDGASNTGAFHEALNLAGIWKLPVVYLSENNLYALTTPTRRAVAVKDIATRASAYGMPGTIVDGQDAGAVYRAVVGAVARAREGRGPSLIEAKTYRYREHAELGGLALRYRSDEEIAEWRRRDPIEIVRARMVELADGAERCEEIERQVILEVDEAVRFAEQSEYPGASELWDNLYSTSGVGH